MATNYTTKTAALKATIADIRKVNAKSVDADEIKVKTGVDSTTQKPIYESVTTLITEAADAATEAAGILVGDEGTLVTVPSLGENPTGGLEKAKGMNFRGNVAVVDNNDGTVDFWFMNPDNHSKPTTATETGAPTGSMYVYDGTVNTDGLEKDEVCNRSIVESSNATLKYTLAGTGKKDDSEPSIMSADNKVSTIKVYVTDGDGTAIFDPVESPAICEANTATKTRGDSITTTANGVTITLTNVIDNTVDANNNDAQEGYTPGYVRFSGNVQVATATVRPDGGTLKVKVVFKSGSTETKLVESGIVYAYQANTLTAADAPTATLTYNVTKNKTISGITYDSEANVKVDVTGIEGTQRGGAHKNAQNARAYVNDITEANSKNYVATLKGDLTTTLESGTATDNTAVFKGSKSAAATNTGDPVRVDITTGAKVQTYEQDGSKSTTAQVISNTLTGDNQPTTWLQTSGASTKTTAAPIHLTFTDDGARVLAAYDGTTMPTSHATYVSATSLLEGDYAKQLLVQGTSLRYPTTDVTGKYSSATGWRSYAVPVTFGEAKTAFIVTTTGTGDWSNNTIRLYLVGVKGDAAKAQCLSWAEGDTAACTAATGAIGVSKGTATSNGSWSVGMDPAWFPVSSTGQDKYYLVVQMSADCNVKLTSLKFA